MRKGQGFPPPRHPDYRAKYNLWKLQPELDLPSPLPHSIEMGWLLKPLRAALEPRLGKLASLPFRNRSWPRISVYIIPWKVVPAFEFAPEDLDFLNRTGLRFVIDIQNFGPEDDE